MQEQNIEQMLENPFMQYNHIEIVSVTSDSAVMSLDTAHPGNKKGLLPARSRTGSSLAGRGRQG